MLVAHRGFRKLTGENRMIDFRNALKVCKAVEFDIRMTKDNKIIIFHDHHFRRIGQTDQTVKNLTYDEIKNIDFFKKNTEYLPPLFIEDFIKELADQYEMINVEIKPDRTTQKEFDLYLQAFNLLRSSTKAEVIISSFSLRTLKYIANLDKTKFKKGYLFEQINEIDFELIKKFDYLHPYVGMLKLKTNIEKIKKINMLMNVWTFKNDKDVKILKSIYGNLINAYISDIENLNINL